jgi:tetratricopeptide (TPR) repeat protein
MILPRSLVGTLAVLVLLFSTGFSMARAQPTEADVYVEQAVVNYQDKRYEDALANLRRALELDPQHVDALYYMGIVQLALGRTTDAIPFLERARAHAPTQRTIAFQLGLAHFALEQYEKARPLLEEVFRAEPTVPNLGYYVGFMRYRNKDYQGALRAFRAGRTTDPQLEQLTRLYTGLALAGVGETGQATAEVERSLQLGPASSLTGPAERLRDALVTARAAERRLSADVRLGVFYDDNTAVVPDPSFRDPLVQTLRQRAHESPGGFVGARGDYHWLRTETWDASIGYSFFGSHNIDTPDFDVTNHLASLATTYKTVVRAMPLQLSAQYSWDILFLKDTMFLRRNTVGLAATLVENEHHLTQVLGRYQNKDFGEPRPTPIHDEVRDANNWMIGGLHLFRFAQDRHLIKLGYQFDYDDTVGRDWEYRGHRLLAGGQYTVPWRGLRFKDDLDVHLREYLHKNTILPTTGPDTKRRRDQEITNVARVELPLPYSLTLSLEHLTVFGESNIKVFDYRRNVTSLIVSWTY